MNEVPVFKKFPLVQVEPLQHVAKCPFGEISMHNAALNLDRDLVLTVNSVEMRRGMLTRKYPDHDSQESRHLRHAEMIPLASVVFNSITHWSSHGGKCGGRAGKQHALIWGDPREEMLWEVSRRHSTKRTSRGLKEAQNEDTGSLDVWEGLNRSAGIRLPSRSGPP